MSTTFLDGPASGQRMMLRRAPVFLRVTQRHGKFDALDQLDDTPEPGEAIRVYILTAAPTAMHILIRGKNKSAGGWYFSGVYRLAGEQPDDAVLRDNHRWRAWCHGDGAALLPKWVRAAGAMPAEGGPS